MRGDQSFFLFGPRGTGKTTWLRQQFPTRREYRDGIELLPVTEVLADPTRPCRSLPDDEVQLRRGQLVARLPQ